MGLRSVSSVPKRAVQGGGGGGRAGAPAPVVVSQHKPALADHDACVFGTERALGVRDKHSWGGVQRGGVRPPASNRRPQLWTHQRLVSAGIQPARQPGVRVVRRRWLRGQ